MVELEARLDDLLPRFEAYLRHLLKTYDRASIPRLAAEFVDEALRSPTGNGEGKEGEPDPRPRSIDCQTKGKLGFRRNLSRVLAQSGGFERLPSKVACQVGPT